MRMLAPAIGALAIALAPAMAAAAQWSMQSGAQLYALAQSNPQLLEGKNHDARAGVGDVSLDLLRRTELFDADLSARAAAYRYGSDAGLDHDEQHLGLALAHHGELYALRGNLSLTRDTTLTSELGTTGITQFNQRHRARAISVAPQWQLTERFSTGLTAGWQDSRYERGAQRGLSDYKYPQIGFNAGFDASETTSASLVIGVGRLDSAAYDFDTDHVDASFQLQHAWSPRWQGSISAGPSWVRAQRKGAQGSIFNASLSRQGERVFIDASLARSTAPNGSGLLSRRDEANLHARLALSSTLDISVRAGAIRSRELLPEFSATISDVRYTHAELSLYWRFMEELNLGLGAGRSEQKFLQGGAAGRNFDARLSLEWRRSRPIG